MIRHLFALTFAALILAGCGLGGDSAVSAPERRLALVDRFLEPGAAIFIGSSTMERLDAGSIAPRAVNMGIGGEGVTQMAARMKGYRSIRDASMVVLIIGANDLREGRSPASVAAELKGALDAVPPSVPVILSGVHLGRSPGALTGAFRDLNRRYAGLCTERPGCIFVDAANVLSTDPECRARNIYDADGIHMNERGYACWSRALRIAARAARA